MIYVRISMADIRAVNRARHAGSQAERDAALHEKVNRHLDECREFAARAGLEIKAEFTERNMSASAQRGMLGGKLKPLPQRDALLAYLAGTESDMIVLSTEIARLYRSVDEAREMIAQATRLNQIPARAAQLIILDIAERVYDLSSQSGRDTFDAAVLAAQAEATSIAIRRRRKERIRARDGLYFGRRPFGYTQDKDAAGTINGRLTIADGTDPEWPVDEAGLIRAAAARVIAEATADPDSSPSLSAIAREWNDTGVPTSRGNRWNGGTVALLLQRPLLTGWVLHRPTGADGRPPKGRPPKRHRATWEPILDAATFDAVGAILADPRRLLNKTGDNRLATPLSGLAWCGACGGRLVSAPMRTGRKDRRLKCAVPGCSKVARAVTPPEAWVRETVLFWLGDGGAYAAHLAGLRAAAGQADTAGRVAELAAQIAVKDTRIAKIAADMAADDTDANLETNRDLIAQIRAARKVLAADLRAAERQAALAAAADGEAGPTPPPDWEQASATEKRDWLRRYVDRVIIHPNPAGLPRHWFDPIALVEVIPGRWWTGPGHPGYPPATVIRPPKAPPRFCDLPGCGEPHEAHGLCKLHNRRRWEAARAGHPDEWDPGPSSHRGRPAPGAPPRVCDLPGCGEPHDAGGLCNKHAIRQRKAARAGHPDDWDRTPAPRRRPRRAA